MPRLAPALRALAAALLVAAGTTRASPPPAQRGDAAVEDDFVRAFAAAKAQGALVLVDVWAPW